MEPLSAANEAVQAVGGGTTSAYVTMGAGGALLIVALWKTLVATMHRMQMDKSSVTTRRGLDESLVEMLSDLRHQLSAERDRTAFEQERADKATRELQEAIRQAAEARGQLEAIKTELEALRREVRLLRDQHGGTP